MNELQPSTAASPRAPVTECVLATRAAHEELMLAMRGCGLDCAAQAYLLADLRARVEVDPHECYVDALRRARNDLATMARPSRCV